MEADHSWSTVTAQREPVRLGEGEFGGATELQPEAMDRAVLVCRSFAELARSHGATSFVAVATSATREAGNQAAFVRRLRDEAGLEVHVVSGPEEARLVFLGVLSVVDLEDRRALVIDIGGGSTEIALGGAAGAEFIDSLRIGAIRLASEFPEASAEAPVPAAAYEAMRRRVQLEAARVRRKLEASASTSPTGPRGRSAIWPASSVRALHGGTPQRIDTLTSRRPAQDGQAAARPDPRGAPPGTRAQPVARRHRGGRRRDPRRPDGGPRSRRASRRSASAACARASSCDHLARAAHAVPGHAPTVRERSVLKLARATAFDETHARHVTALALELFDSAGAAGLHRYGDERA